MAIMNQSSYIHKGHVHDHASHNYPVVAAETSTVHVGHESHDSHSMHVRHQIYFNTELGARVLFEQWVLNSKGNIFLACLCTFVLAMGYQATKWFRQYMHIHYRDKIHSIKSREHLLQTILYIAEFLVSYILMLVVMTYNIWVFVVTIIGIAFGYFLLAWHKEFKPKCAPECSNRIQDVDIVIECRQLTQELMPLSCSQDACKGCNLDPLDNVEEAKETDILT